MSGKAGLNPRFDGAFLIQSNSSKPMALNCLNPRFDGAFLIRIVLPYRNRPSCLNPRFDGAFLIPKAAL